MPETTAQLWDRGTPHDARRELFGGRGLVRVWSLVDVPMAPFTAVLACELEPGASVGAHVQEQYPELVMAIAGSGSVDVNGDARPFNAGSVIELGVGQVLAIANASTEEPLRYLIIKAEAPAGGSAFL